MLRYAITSRMSFPGDEPEQRNALLRYAYHWVRDGIDFIQLREKDLSSDALAALASGILEAIAATPTPTRLLINSRAEVAVAIRAHGVHLTASPEELTPADVRGLYASAKLPPPVVSVSCHSLIEVERARTNKADAILFAPVFEKWLREEKWLRDEKSLEDGRHIEGRGLDMLGEACRAASPVPVFALGGITQENAAACLAAGAAGVAGIRLFHGD
jgi:thiamine-phosphate pyrophosphorylase